LSVVLNWGSLDAADLMNLGLRTVKNTTGVSTHPTGGAAIIVGFATHSVVGLYGVV